MEITLLNIAESIWRDWIDTLIEEPIVDGILYVSGDGLVTDDRARTADAGCIRMLLYTVSGLELEISGLYEQQDA